MALETVRTKYGFISGVKENGYTVFKGVPYAKPPIGELRFRAPQPPENGLQHDEISVRLVHEDIAREAGYMLPQSGNTHALLREWVNNPPADDFPVAAAKELLESIPDNDKKTKKYKCLVCNAEFEAEEGEEPICPICKAKGDQLVEIK